MTDLPLYDRRNEWSAKYKPLIGEGVRYHTVRAALNLFTQRGGLNIVETGTARARNDFGGGGMSTIYFGEYAYKNGYHLFTIDILPEAIELSKELTKEFASHITYITADAVEHLRGFDRTIDLLYLDSLDCPTDPDFNNPKLIASQKHQLAEFMAAEDFLHSGSLVLLDDNGHDNGGKCTLTKEYLRKIGWECILDEYQSLWQKAAE